ncbi:MAG: lytic transglycosylase domain-containing protein [Spirochaetales bacterium]|nr:lytic transglycosylase domain-containing protein [Spirochaetales bacterium]
MGVSFKQILPVFFFFLFLFPGCSESPEDRGHLSAEELYFASLDRGFVEDLLLDSAEAMVEPWSGLALYELSLSYLDRPVPPSLGKISRLWKKYTARYGYDGYSRDVRNQISLLSNQDPLESPLLGEGEGDDFYSYLYSLGKGKARDFEPLRAFLAEERTERELNLLLHYLGSRGLMDDIPRPYSEWLTVKLLLLKKEYGAAEGKISYLENEPSVNGLAQYYRDVWRALLSHGERRSLLTRWEYRADILDEEARWSLLFYSALCRRSMNEFTRSAELLKLALEPAPGESEYDRTLWYYLDVQNKKGANLSSLLVEWAPLWHDSAFYDDLVETTVSDGVYRGDWKGLARLQEAMALYGSSHSRDITSWVTVTGSESRYLYLSDEEVARRLEGIVERNEGSLFTLMAEYLTEGKVSYYSNLRSDGETSRDKSSDEKALVLSGLIERSYTAAARKWYDRYGHELALEVLRDYAYYLRRQGDYLESIRVMGKASRREDYVVSREDLTLLYPLEYAGPIEYWCGEYGISQPFFQALIKTESGYDKDIVSYAGAVGLSQLMPTTAEDHMRRLGLEGADLTEPDVNIALGTRYLNWLYEREYIDSPVLAAAAYNGGPGSVRKWNRTMGGYPRLLYMEGIPYTQTRDYVKSLVQGAVVYSFLYDNRPPEEVLSELLPELAG